MTDRKVLEEIYLIVAPLKDGRCERQIKKLLRWALGDDRCHELDLLARPPRADRN